jgi:23S rRNA pseudouridine1911/1915/1917 synthase
VKTVFAHPDCLVVNKEAGESTEPRPPPNMKDLPALLQDSFGPVTAVHRLDVPVSGCVLFARNRRALSLLGRAFAEPCREGRPGEKQERKVRKIYWAIAETPDRDFPESGELLHWIAAAGGKSEAFDEDGPGRKKALLRYRRAGQGERYLFLEIDLITGRRHQIRAQLARLGLRIKGDLKYGARRSEKAGGIRLHAYSLSFPDPAARTGEIIRVCAAPPLRDRLWEAFAQCPGLVFSREFSPVCGEG